MLGHAGIKGPLLMRFVRRFGNLASLHLALAFACPTPALWAEGAARPEPLEVIERLSSDWEKRLDAIRYCSGNLYCEQSKSPTEWTGFPRWEGAFYKAGDEMLTSGTLVDTAGRTLAEGAHIHHGVGVINFLTDQYQIREITTGSLGSGFGYKHTQILGIEGLTVQRQYPKYFSDVADGLRKSENTQAAWTEDGMLEVQWYSWRTRFDPAYDFLPVVETMNLSHLGANAVVRTKTSAYQKVGDVWFPHECVSEDRYADGRVSRSRVRFTNVCLGEECVRKVFPVVYRAGSDVGDQATRILVRLDKDYTLEELVAGDQLVAQGAVSGMAVSARQQQSPDNPASVPPRNWLVWLVGGVFAAGAVLTWYFLARRTS